MLDSFMEIMDKGGVLMYPLLLLSILSFGIFLERLYSLKKERYIPRLFIEKLYEALRTKDLSAAKTLSSADGSSMARVVTVILDNLDLPMTRLMDTAEEAGRYEVRILEKYLPSLQIIATISPLIGLLGTVLGMVQSFTVIGGQGVGDPLALAGGISEALLTTVGGLCVAIPTMIFYFIVRSKSEKVSIELEQSTSNILNLIFKEDSK